MCAAHKYRGLEIIAIKSQFIDFHEIYSEWA
jgi:hypothetical protein